MTRQALLMWLVCLVHPSTLLPPDPPDPSCPTSLRLRGSPYFLQEGLHTAPCPGGCLFATLADPTIHLCLPQPPFLGQFLLD